MGDDPQQLIAEGNVLGGVLEWWSELGLRRGRGPDFVALRRIAAHWGPGWPAGWPRWAEYANGRRPLVEPGRGVAAYGRGDCGYVLPHVRTTAWHGPDIPEFDRP